MGSRAALRRGIGAAAAAALATALAASVGSAASAESPAVPSVRLLAADRDRTATLHSDRRGRVSLEGLGLFVAAAGGEFRIDLARPEYQALRAVQVDGRSGAVLRELPEELVGGWRGLERFWRISFRDADAKRVAGAARRFCPNAGTRERVDDSGPATPRYPRGCTGGFPFLRGKVWGIDAGWATSPSLGKVKLAPGRYTARVRIAPAYRELFGIPPGDARAVLSVRVRRSRDPGGPAPGPEPERAAGEDPRAPLAAPAVADPDPATLPDLEALPLWRIRAQSRGKRDLLSFAASPWNAGPAPLVVEGYRRSGEDVMDAYQYFFDADGNAVGRAPAGTMEFHESRGHDHWHFEQFARFSLIDPDRSRVVRSRKQSYCIMPTDAVDLTLRSANWRPGGRGGSSCGEPSSIWIRERLAAGWADTYDQSVAGQALDITKVPNGRYRVRMEVNPRGELHEVSAANNVADRVVILRGARGARRVVVKPGKGIKR